MGRGWRPLDGLMRGNSVVLRTAVDAESAPPAPRPSSSGPCTRLSCAVYAFGPRGAVGTHVGASRLELSPRAPGRWSLVAGFLASGALERARGEKTTGSGSRDFWNRRDRAEPNLPSPSPVVGHCRALDAPRSHTVLVFDLAGKVHGSLARAGKVRGQTPKVAPQEKAKKPTGRACKRLKYNRRFVNVVTGFGKKRGPNSQ